MLKKKSLLMKSLLVAALTSQTLFAMGCSREEVNKINTNTNKVETGITEKVQNKYELSHLEKIDFSGYEWYIKAADEVMGPGNNYFSNSKDNVWVDDDGNLHMKIINKEGKWICSEIVCAESLGYGKYVFNVDSRLDKLDKNVVFGMFTYDLQDKDGKNHNREIDIEFSKWGKEDSENSQFVIQPYEKKDNLYRFDTELTGSCTAHVIDWNENYIEFSSHHGFDYKAGKELEIARRKYEGNYVPDHKYENIRVNLYLFNGKSPSDNKEVEIVIKEFNFIPYKN